MTNDPRFTFIGPGLIELSTPQEQIATLTARIGVLEEALRDLADAADGQAPDFMAAWKRLHDAQSRARAALASPEVKPTGEGRSEVWTCACGYMADGWICTKCGGSRPAPSNKEEP